jgi:trehalose 6-phosphate synthase/phosphatase
MHDFKERLRAHTKQRNVIFSSVDRNHVFNGIKNKLLAFQQVLENIPRYRNQLCLVQYMTPYECPQCLQSQCEHEDRQYQDL